MKTASGSFRLVRILAWRRIAARPVRSCLTAAGVAVGVGFLFSIMSLNAQLASTARHTAAVVDRPRLLQVTPASPGGLPDDLAGQLAADGRVAAAAPLVIARAAVTNGPHEASVFVIGITGDAPLLAPDAAGEIDFELAESVDPDSGLALSHRAAERLHVSAGDQIAVHASTGITHVPVSALVSSPQIERLNSGMAAMMPLADAQTVFGRTGRVDQILLLATTDADLDALRRDVGAAIDGIGIVAAPGETTGGGNVYFDTIRFFTNFVGAFVVLAGVMLVFHTMSTATAERRTEIALARSLGSSRRQLLAVTLTEAAFLGAAGTALGLFAGGMLARLVVPLARHMYEIGSPVDVPTDVAFHWVPAVVAAVAGLTGAILGAVIPGRSAARAAPIDAFRPTANYEWRDPSRASHQVLIASAGAALLIAGAILARRVTSDNPTDPAVVVPVLAAYLGALILVPTTIPFAARAAATLLGRLSNTTGRLAADALRANPRRTTLNVMALLVPVAAVVLTGVGFGSGLTGISRLAQAVVGTPINVDADSYIGVLGGSVASQPLGPAHQSVLEAVPGVRAVLPYQAANAVLPDGSAGAVYAVPLTAADRHGVADAVKFARLANNPAAFTRGLAQGEIAASHVAARSLALEPGSRLSLPTPSGPQEFTVSALFDDWTFQSTFAIDLDTYRSIWGDDAAYRYAIVPTADASLSDLRVRLEAAVADAAMPAHVRTREQAVAELEANTTTFLPIARGMTLATLIFAGLALGNAAFTAITEQRWTLALQRALGMSRRQISRSLALEATTVGVIGAIGGTAVGLGLAAAVLPVLARQVAITLHYTVPWPLVAAATVLGVVVAVSATFHPRRIARRVPIIEGLRFE